MDGWIKLYRKILDNPIVCKDSDHLAVWVYLLLNATHKQYQTIFMGKKITLRPGQLITGRKVIAEKFKISESKVQRILKSFENEHQIEQQNGNKNRLITILSWDEYQFLEHQDEHLLNNKRTTTEQQVNTYKNDKNVKKDKNKTSSRNKPKVYSEEDNYYQMAVYLHERIMEHAAFNKKDHLVRNADMQKWADEFRKIVELDKRDTKELRKVIDWTTADPFWQLNILSPAALRKQYVQLAMKMETNPIGRNNTQQSRFARNKALLNQEIVADKNISSRDKEAEFQQYIMNGGDPDAFDWS